MRWIANGARERLSRSSVDDGDELARGAAGDAGPFFRAAAESDAFARESDAVARAPRTATPIIALVICRDVRLKRTREMVSALSTPSFGFHFILCFIVIKLIKLLLFKLTAIYFFGELEYRAGVHCILRYFDI